MLEIVEEILKNIFSGFRAGDRPRCVVDALQMLKCQGRWRSSVKLGNLVQNFDSFCFFASADEKFGGFVETKNEKSEKEHG